MRPLPPLLKAALESGTVELARVWTITRPDSSVYRFTDHDKDITIGANVFRHTDSFQVSNVTHSLAGGAQAASMNVFLGSNAATHLTYNDLTEGKFRNSLLSIDIVVWSDSSLGVVNLFTGYFSDIEIDVIKNSAVIDVKGIMSRSIPAIGQKFSAECRADLGDARCGVNLSLHSATGIVTAVTSNRKFEATLTPNPNNFEFSFGKIVWNTGLNTGVRQELLTQYGVSGSDDLLMTALFAPKTIQIGDTFTATKGCDFRPETCKTRFGNIANFRGEPFVPGPDYISETPEPI